MLVLSRKKNEKIIIGRDIEVKVLSISPTAIKLGVAAPREVQIDRGEKREQKP